MVTIKNVIMGVTYNFNKAETSNLSELRFKTLSKVPDL